MREGKDPTAVALERGPPWVGPGVSSGGRERRCVHYGGPGRGAMPGPVVPGRPRPPAAPGSRGKASVAPQRPEGQPCFRRSCKSLRTDPKCYFIIYRGKKCLFFRISILLNVYMYRQSRNRRECLRVTDQCSPRGERAPGGFGNSPLVPRLQYSHRGRGDHTKCP